MELLDYKLDMSTMGRPMLIGDLLAIASLLYEPMSVRLNPTATKVGATSSISMYVRSNSTY